MNRQLVKDRLVAIYVVGAIVTFGSLVLPYGRIPVLILGPDLVGLLIYVGKAALWPIYWPFRFATGLW